MASRPRFLPYLAFTVTAGIWGSTFLVIRISNEAMPPVWAASMRLLLAGCILSAVLLVSRQPFPKGEAFKAAVAYGACTMGINFSLLYWGETRLPSGLAAVLYATSPISAALLARAFGLEQLTPRKLIAAVLAVIGVAVIFWHEMQTGLPAWPILAVLGAAIFGVLGAILLKRGPKQSAIGSNAIGAFVGAPLAFLASTAFGEAHAIPSTAAQIMPLLYLTIAGSVGAFVIFAWLLGRWQTSSVAFLGAVVPVIAVILGAVVKQEHLSGWSLIGGVIVLVATLTAILGEKNGH
ncbi:MAG: EamA family transporter [Fimbriimonas ginsengisoli]|uniref:EamA family transporter n=1 Tax=Fimbriimonas ginsengisoli TaxID=1005039 RepID=A0A931PVI1_FIMGI|nr:EamA family transporter [Fimbriimonas ginsengisoli]